MVREINNVEILLSDNGKGYEINLCDKDEIITIVNSRTYETYYSGGQLYCNLSIPVEMATELNPTDD